MSAHLGVTELEPWLGGEPSAEFEAHLEACDACGALLAREAELELALVKLDRERRCGTAEWMPTLPIQGRAHSRTRPAAGSRRVLTALGAVLVILVLATPRRSRGFAVESSEPCAGTPVDGGAWNGALQPNEPLALGGEVHGTP